MRSKSYRVGYVYVRDTFAGTVKETEDGYEFAYDKDYLGTKDPLPVSLTLPIKTEPYYSKTLFPFFDGLIPEGWLLNIVSKNWKLDQKDRFGLLLYSCRDCIGDVWIGDDRV